MLTARDLEARAHALAHRRGQAEAALLVAGACLAAGGLVLVLTGALELPLASGAALGLLVAAAEFVAYRETVARMALDPAAYAIPEVDRYGRRYATAAERARLASWLRDVLRESTMSESWCLADRVRGHARQLECLATELASPQASIRPACAVACRRLLTCGAESPLYNPRIPSDEIGAVVMRIRHGIGYDPGNRATELQAPAD